MSAVNCESCGQNGAGPRADPDGGPPYILCSACAYRLETRSLRPAEWFRLAALHGWTRYFLHDDFYDDDGTAAQPAVPVENAEQHPFPLKEQWAGSLPLALDVAYVKWRLDPELSVLLAAKPEQTLELLRKTMGARKNPTLRARALEIAASSLGPTAAEWVRGQWSASPQSFLFPLAQASAACLPRSEALSLVIAALEAGTGRMDDRIACLSWFRDEAALDAIEKLVQSPLTSSWGRVAAACGLSWDRACRWLDGGRPLSLVALDALVAMVHYDTPLLKELQPHLPGPVEAESIRRVLSSQAERDPVPRVNAAVRRLLKSADELAHGSR